MKNFSQMEFYRKTVAFMNQHFPVLLAKMRFWKLFGKPLHLRNPQDINEKILWLSLFSDTSVWSRLADKYAVREYVKECGLEHILVRLYGKWDNPENIVWDDLPQEFVLKSNNGTGTVLIVEDKSKLDYQLIVPLLKSWLYDVPGTTTTEFHYNPIKPCIIAEELLHQPEDEKSISSTLIDYKVWCFNGKADSIWTCANRMDHHTNVALFDTDWNYRPEASVFIEGYEEQSPLVPKPDCLYELLKCAEILASPFPVVRVDLYVVKGKIYFGEMTFTSYGGTMTFYSEQELLRMGKKIDISKVKKK